MYKVILFKVISVKELRLLAVILTDFAATFFTLIIYTDLYIYEFEAGVCGCVDLIKYIKCTAVFTDLIQY